MQLAVVAANRCAGCGICAGACPSATPFRSAQRLATGIDLPQHSLDTLRRQLHAALSHASGRGKVVVFGCQHGAGVATADTADAIVFSLRCSGQLPPAFIGYALRCGAGGVVISACSTGACEYRLGSRWTAARLAANREPRLRRSVPENRYRLVFADAGDEPVLAAAIAAAGDGRAAGVRS
jgi:coenzyme F420-reducing hydrogenase delta subunit